MGAWLYTNGEAVYGAKPVNIKTPDGIFLSQKENKEQRWLYIFITKPVEKLTLPLSGKGNCTLLDTKRPIPYQNTDKGICIELPQDLFQDSSIAVLKIEI